MTKGRVKAGRGTLIGNAGEYFVMGELLRRDVVAGMAPRNSPDFDILIQSGVHVRVKTKADSDSWVWMRKKDGTIFTNIHERDFTVLVDLADSQPTYYIFETQRLNDLMRHDRPGRMVRYGNARWGREGLAEAEGRWELITKEGAR